MKKWMTVLMFGGLLSTVGMVDAAPSATTPGSAPAEAASDDALPCHGCCPPYICGLNGPSLDGTTTPAECSAR